MWDCVGNKLSLNPAVGTCENMASSKSKGGFVWFLSSVRVLANSAPWELSRQWQINIYHESD